MHNTTRFRRFIAVPVALTLGAGLALTGCGGDDTPAPETSAADTSSTSGAEATADDISIDDAWARTSPAAVTNGAAYMQITNSSSTDDALVDVSVDANVARTAELHETSMAEDRGDDGTDSDMGSDTSDMPADTAADDHGSGGGMMTMREVDEIPVAAGQTAVLEPGGYHVMLLDLVEPLKVGDTVEIRLVFANAGEIVVEAEIRDAAP